MAPFDVCKITSSCRLIPFYLDISMDFKRMFTCVSSSFSRLFFHTANAICDGEMQYLITLEPTRGRYGTSGCLPTPLNRVVSVVFKCMFICISWFSSRVDKFQQPTSQMNRRCNNPVLRYLLMIVRVLPVK